MNWEEIDDRHSARLKVPYGWIVRTVYNAGVHQIFVEDQDHIWGLEDEKKEKKHWSEE
jgi:hypothetical protein